VKLERDRAVVLRTYKLGEADRIIVLMTEAHGKVRAVAKGVRKTTSRLGARLEPTSHVVVQLYRGRQLDTITQVESIEAHAPLRTDLDRLTRAASLLEVIDQVALEREPDAALYRMLVGGLRAVEDGAGSIVVAAFYLKLLAAQGVGPIVDVCVACGAAEDLVSFDVASGGLLCRSDRRGVRVSPGAVSLLRDITGGRLNDALTRPDSPAVAEVGRLATEAMEAHLERRLRAPGLLDRA
jgi:DNA repair protein RecO (recombination protein O)